ncbi:helix-turn-helix transcriptional regulator [Salinibacterium sp. ZJ70]|uniref:ArsR/SmtB family transcription factor n=1 Tax=Salinibacterium sp. ZJ70 TaxID=2708084 RepID=UPI00141FE307|nr:metalloregulator ArsR/SmtB family transcription factor [Salinibacterium sp. ZJ70]
MSAPTDQIEDSETLDRVFSALADPTRRALLARLAQGQTTVGELAEPFDITFAAVSKHVRVLEQAGLVTRSREGQYRPARLEGRPLRIAATWIGGYAQFWSDSLDAMGARLGRVQSTQEPQSPQERRPS